MVTTALQLEYFGIRVRVAAPPTDLADVAFHAGPHVRPTAEAPHFEVAIEALRGGVRQAIVRRGELTALRRPFRSWTNLPPPIPPFAAVEDRLALLPAVVLAREGIVLALIGSGLSAKGSIGIALARRGWAFVSGQLLVVDRRTGQVRPYLAPVELRGAAVRELASSGLAGGTWRSMPSRISSDAILVRPESLGRVVPITVRLPGARLVRLCARADERLCLTRCPVHPQPWPMAAAGALSDLPSYRLELPTGEVADEAAELLGVTLRADEEQPCPDAPRTAPERRVGLTA